MNYFYKFFLFVWLIVVFLASFTLSAQTHSANRIDEIKRALQRAEFQIAADLADSAIAHFREYSPQQLAGIHAFRALVFFERGQIERAEEHLALALQIDPALKLDPIFFSPQIQQRLEELRPKIVTLGQATAPTTIRYLVMTDPRVAATWRSLLLPGWGQRFKGQNAKGRAFAIAAIALAGATITSHIWRDRAEKNYLTAGENEVEARYDTFNRYHLLRNNLALALGLVWSAAVLDAFIVRVEPKANGVGFTTPPPSTPATIALGLKVSF